MFCAFQQPDVIAEEPQRQKLAEQAGGHGRRVFLAERFRQQVGVDDHGALSHQAVVDQVVQRGNRKGSTFGAHIVDNEQVGALVACSAFCGASPSPEPNLMVSYAATMLMAVS